MTKCAIVISDIEKSIAMENWLNSLVGMGLRFFVIFIGDPASRFTSWVSAQGILCEVVPFRTFRDYPLALIKTIGLLRKHRATAIHCHLRKANLVGLPAAKILGISRRVFTRHHGNQHWDTSRRGVWEDRFCNYLATHIIAPSQNVRDILVSRDRAPASKVRVIWHSFRPQDYQSSPKRVEELRERYRLGPHDFVVGAISRLVDCKGVNFLVEAFERFARDNSRAVLLIANATGPGRSSLEHRLRSTSGIRYILVDFEDDIASLLGSFNVFVHVPVDPAVEAFGQVYVEALASRTVCIFTLSGIAREFIFDDQAVISVPFRDQDAIFRALQRAYSMNKDERLRRTELGAALVASGFEPERLSPRYLELYR